MISRLESLVFHRVADGTPDLRAGDVHLWMADLTSVSEANITTLTADEWLRASRFHFAVDQRRYVATRTVVRQVLARYLCEDPAALEFVRGPYGKPVLSGVAPFLRFNLSHSHDLLLLAVTFGREIGVDVEAVRSQVEYNMLADHYFPPEEQWALRITPPQLRYRKFFELWTLNEARLKAHGRGLSASPEREQGELPLTIHSFEPASGYAAAVAVEGDAWELTCLQWQN